MPNWTFNKIIASEKVLNAFWNKEDECFDFNKIIPMPEELEETTQGSITEDALEYFRTNKEKGNPDRYNLSPQEFYSLGARFASNIENYGFPTWYGWCNFNWGTKWNACESYREEGIGYFDTAWCAPLPIFSVLCNTFPDEEIYIESTYEDNFFQSFENYNGYLSLVEECELIYNEETEEYEREKI